MLIVTIVVVLNDCQIHSGGAPSTAQTPPVQHLWVARRSRGYTALHFNSLWQFVYRHTLHAFDFKLDVICYTGGVSKAMTRHSGMVQLTSTLSECAEVRVTDMCKDATDKPHVSKCCEKVATPFTYHSDKYAYAGL